MENNRSEKAVALRYDHAIGAAPVVTAKGQGAIAEKIKELAKKYGVPVEENQCLAEYLMALDLYEEIPPILYPVVAEILAFIYRTNNKYEMRMRSRHA